MSETPIMQQYSQIKEQHKDSILFFRLGDFYEMFFEDAQQASQELGLVLTGRKWGDNVRAPMCGVPFHSADAHIAKLVANGHKVAICEQMDSDKNAKLVKREVVRIVTPGTIMDDAILYNRTANYLASIYKNNDKMSVCFADVSTGEVAATVYTDDVGCQSLINDLARYMPSEVILNEQAYNDAPLQSFIKERLSAAHFRCPENNFDAAVCLKSVCEQFPDAQGQFKASDALSSSTGALISYLKHTQKADLRHMSAISLYAVNEFMDIGAVAQRNLELVETMRDKTKRGSLFWVLDQTRTSMGGRLLRSWIMKPLVNSITIQKRLLAVEELVNNLPIRGDIIFLLSKIFDIERIVGKLSLEQANARDLNSLRASLENLPELIETVCRLRAALTCEQAGRMDRLDDVTDLISRAIADEPPVSLKEGGLIREGFNEEIDQLRHSMTEGKNWIAQLETEEREKTGIKNLKVGFNRVFGYYIEVSKSNAGNVPDYFVRKQTLTNGERYITPRLKEIENIVLGAEERITAMEYHVFREVRDNVTREMPRVQATARAIGVIDALCALAETAVKYKYCMPDVNTGNSINIKDGRHPVVERVQRDSLFVANDAHLDDDQNRTIIITGPNMAGKSTYMRQTALIVLMAQIGSFVPAQAASIGIVDKLFTRVGASDDLAAGQSTFMVEMSEVASILKGATPKSLLILDEIGRGTSTYDGLSIAWAVIEYIVGRVGSKALFATHYHELTELEDKLPGVKNYCVSVKKRGLDITFLRKIVRGGADESFGVEVARLAGVPDDVVKRAKDILGALEESDVNRAADIRVKAVEQPRENAGQFAGQELINELTRIDVNTYTPIEALGKLYELQKKAREAGL